MIAPEWTTRISDRDVAGEDQLGLEGAAQSYQQYLVPGIISTTDHARYYSFYSWVLYRFIHDPESSRFLEDFKGPYYKRHEVALMMGCYSHHKDSGGFPGLVGAGVNQYKARRIWERGDPVSLDEHYFENKLGGFGQYYRPVMQTMGLVAEPERRRLVYRLTKRGLALAQAFEDSVRQTHYFKALQDQGQLTTLSHENAANYGAQACLCAEAVGQGADRELLRDAFFRFERTGLSDPHVRRRLTMGLILDLVAQSGSVPLQQTLRRALYLGNYTVNQPYQPMSTLADWAFRWQMVQVRHTYTSALQALWAVFLDHLRNIPDRGFSFAEFADWVTARLTPEQSKMPTSAYLNHLCDKVGPAASWQEAAESFADVCQEASGIDEITLYQQLLDSDREPGALVSLALQIMSQLFLRFYPLAQSDHLIWAEMANHPRLPLAQLFTDLTYYLQSPTWTVGDFLTWLYRDYIVGQHEVIALQKLRQNDYDTFKFYYRNGRFSWAYNPPDYKEPLRYPGLRLYNGLSMLIDLGLVVEDTDGVYALTADGQSYLTRLMGADDGH